mmetsp:Transcript_21685/g.69827  ORF Transcript_21685/g.69827 Transcript_21685/m.69827 type:complete len:256 (+) Transcript_21685:63-830(+)
MEDSPATGSPLTDSAMTDSPMIPSEILQIEYDDDENDEPFDTPEKKGRKQPQIRFLPAPPEERRPVDLAGLDLYSQVTARKVEESLSKLTFYCQVLCRSARAGVFSRTWRPYFCVVFAEGSLALFRTGVDFIDYVCNPYLNPVLQQALVDKKFLLDKRVAAGPVKSKAYDKHGLLANFRLSRDNIAYLKIAGPEHVVQNLRELIALKSAEDLDSRGVPAENRSLSDAFANGNSPGAGDDNADDTTLKERANTVVC